MKKYTILYTLAGFLLASCSTTIERRANAFGGSWEMSEKKENFEAQKGKTDTKALFFQESQIQEQSALEIPSENTQSAYGNPINSYTTENALGDYAQNASKALKNSSFFQRVAIQKYLAQTGLLDPEIKKKTQHERGIIPAHTDQKKSTQKPDTKKTKIARLFEVKQGLDSNEKLIAVLLGLLFLVGIAGMHRVYLGAITHNNMHYLVAVIQFLTFGACGIWAVIDIIRIIAGDLGNEPRNNFNKEL